MDSNSILDDEDARNRLDPSDMLGIVERSPGFMEWCLDTFGDFSGTTAGKEVSDMLDKFPGNAPNGIFIVGMGGSAISGDLVHDWLKDTCPVPVLVVRGYDIPAHINDGWLGIFLSYSGNTEETLSCFLRSIERRIPCIGITSGGLLKDFLNRRGLPCFEVPGGFQPRAALLYLFTTLAIVVANLGIMDGSSENPGSGKNAPAATGPSSKEGMLSELRETLDVLKEQSRLYNAGVPLAENPMKQAAVTLHGSIVAVFGFDHYISVARRFKGQLNENGKNPAYYDFFSELNHNETVGWEINDEVSKNVSVVLIRDKELESPPIKVRIEYTRDILERKARHVIELEPRGKSRLARMMSLVHQADFASVYLALLNGKDPTPVTYIQGLKDVLKGKIDLQSKLKEKLEKIID